MPYVRRWRLAFAFFANAGGEIGLQVTGQSFDISQQLESSSCERLRYPGAFRVAYSAYPTATCLSPPAARVSPLRPQGGGSPATEEPGGGLVPTNAAWDASVLYLESFKR